MPRLRELTAAGAIDEDGVTRHLPNAIINAVKALTPAQAEAYAMARLDNFWPNRPVEIYLHVYATNPLSIAWLITDIGVTVESDWWVDRG